MPASAPTSGTLLVAPPTLRDPNFQRSVVLLCEHGADGSFGLILNRPLDVQLGEVLDGVYGYEEPLSLGGPVQQDTLHYLHRYGDDVPEAIPITDGVYWGGDFEILKALIHDRQPGFDDLRFFLGYAGWSIAQLDAEIDNDGWILTSAVASEVFSEDPETLWRDVLRRMGGEYALLSNYPDNPRMN